MLQDVRDYTAALDFNIDILADRDDLHGESSRGGVSTGNGLSGGDTPEAIIPSFSPVPSLAPAPTSAPATAASKESCLRGGEKKRIPNTFKEAMSLPKAAYWKEAADKEIQSLEKHGVYELVPMFFVLSSQNVVGTRWVNKIKADGTFKAVWSCRDGPKSPVSIMGVLSLQHDGRARLRERIQQRAVVP